MSFKDRNTRLFFEGERVRAFRKFADQAVRRLTLLDRTDALSTTWPSLPGNRLEALPGERAGQHSIRINAEAADLFPMGLRRTARRRDRGRSIGRGRERALTPKNGMRPVHPGEILRDELQALGMSANALSKALGVPVNRVTAILHGQRGVTADTALRLARYFGTTPQVWLNLQQTYELRRAEITVGRRIAESVQPQGYSGRARGL